jgi:hypothetical protein
VHINAEGNLFSVADNGRGHAVDRGVAGAPFLQFIYTQLGCPLDAVKGGPGSASRHRHVAAEPAVLCVVGHHTEVLQNAATDIPETYLKEDAGEKRNSKRSRTDRPQGPVGASTHAIRTCKTRPQRPLLALSFVSAGFFRRRLAIGCMTRLRWRSSSSQFCNWHPMQRRRFGCRLWP